MQEVVSKLEQKSSTVISSFWNVDYLKEWVQRYNPPLPEVSVCNSLNLFTRMIHGLPVGTLLVQEPAIIEGVEIVAAIYNTLVRGSPNLALDVEHGKVVENSGVQAPSLLPLTRIADTIDFLDWVHELRCSNPPSRNLERRANGMVRAIHDYSIPVYRLLG